MLLITIFVELRVVAGRSRRQAGSPERHGQSMAWHGKCELDTAALCKSNGKRHLLNPQRHDMAGERHGRGMGTACYV
jgi:hypothetical protein